MRGRVLVIDDIRVRPPDGAEAGALPWRIRAYASLPEAEPAWRRAVAAGGCSVFQTYEWLSAWWETLGARAGTRPCIVHVTARDGTDLLLLPLGIRRRAGLRVLEFLGGDRADYAMPVVAPAASWEPARVALLWAGILEALPPVDLVRLQRMPRRLDGVENPLAQLPGLRPDPLGASGAALPSTFEAFAKARSTQFFAQNRRLARRLAETGPVRLTFAESEAERLAVTRFVIAQKARWQRESGLRDTFARGEVASFYERVTRTAFREGGIGAAGLWVGGDLVAGLWGAEFRGRYVYLVSSYRPDWSRFAVGRLLTEGVIRALIARGDLHTYDLTVGDEGYKASWADHALPLLALVAGRTRRGRLAAAFLAAVPALRASGPARRALALLRRTRRVVRRRTQRAG
ncbi:GNAT family N-acetyltransferase [Methylobacterium sp. JK268]